MRSEWTKRKCKKRAYRDIFEPLENVLEVGPCIEYQGSLDGQGYGRFYFQGKYYSTHRISYIKNFGRIPDGLMVLHKCDNRKCVNPSHLYAGSSSDNAHDRYRCVTEKKVKNRIYKDKATISLKVSREFHQCVLLKCVDKKSSIKQYIIDLIERDIK
jgi:hypothetical protein